MKLAASRQLAEYPTDLTALADGVVILTMCEQDSSLQAFDGDLAPVWSKRLEARGIAFATLDRVPWLLDQEGAWALGEQGAALARIQVGPRHGMHLAAFAPVPGGFVFAWEHCSRTIRPPILERVNFDSTVVWSVTLPVGSVEYEGVVQMRADEGWRPRPVDPWVPETWFSRSPRLTISGDAVLACYSEMPRSGIGFGYMVSLEDGNLRFTTRRGPINEVAALGGGAFLVGYQGYGAFETILYDRKGRTPDRWPSHGYYLLGDELRAIELENRLPSKMHLVRLLPGAKCNKGRGSMVITRHAPIAMQRVGSTSSARGPSCQPAGCPSAGGSRSPLRMAASIRPRS